MNVRTILSAALGVAAVLSVAFVPGAWAREYRTISSGGTESGDVIVELTPEAVEDGTLTVRFTMNTHSVSLSTYDLAEITTLEYDGKTLRPAEASRLRGHHAAGELVFTPGEDVKDFTIRITGIPSIRERVFTWTEGAE